MALAVSLGGNTGNIADLIGVSNGAAAKLLNDQ
jgi:hypothetical protein